MGDVMTAAALAAELSNHGLAVGVSMTLLTGRNLTMFRMAEGAGLIGVSGLALHECFVDLGMTAAADLFRLGNAEGDVQRIVGVGVTAQTIRILQIGAVPFLVVAVEAGGDLTVFVMAAGAGVIGKVFGVGRLQDLVDLGMAFVLMAGAAILLRRIAGVFDDHRVVRASVTGHAHLGLNSDQMEGLATGLTVAVKAARDITMSGVTVGAGEGGVLAGEVLQLLGRAGVAVDAEARFHAGQIKRGMGVGVAVVAGLGLLLGAVGETVTVGALGQGVGILNLAGGIGVVNLMAEGALFLVTMTRGLQLVEHGKMALGALLHGQGLDRLVKEGRTRRHLLDLVGEVNLAGPGVPSGAQDEYGPGKQATYPQAVT